MADPLNILHTVGFSAMYPMVRAEISLKYPLDHQRLTTAVTAVAKVVPELMQAYRIKDNEFYDIHADASSVLHFVDQMDESYAGRLDWETQPQWELYVTDHQLIVYGSHILTDGAGFKQLLYLLCSAYNADGDIDIENHQDISEIKELLRQIPAKPSTNNDHPTQALSLPGLVNDGESRQYAILQQSLTPSQFSQLHQWTHSSGVTINDAIMTAFAKAVQQCCGVSELNLACPTDMRQFLPEDQQKQLRIQNMTGRYNVSVPAALDEEFATTVAKVHEAMDQQKANYTFLESFRTMLTNLDNGASVSQLQKDVESHYHVRGIAYTNMAIVDDTRLQFAGDHVINCILTGGFRTMPHYQICACTFKGRLNLAANVIATEEEKHLAYAVMSLMRQYLLPIN
ncbi:MAG TPA: hypothetical protein H9856_03530 [Candidatus Limosilactobacillus merdigallinarum]|uniref:Condensation domain-containing protein n=1 Tax=Candidatus Limosilactobacillus merdigallinarum TaxID=2838652 RepID=A0A9D1VHH7_9LACO|nr:hypothetical protein [Candidatus Limosilactobacillus merdigallinarum]